MNHGRRIAVRAEYRTGYRASFRPRYRVKDTDKPEELAPVSWRGTALAIITILVLLGGFITLVAQMSTLAKTAKHPVTTSASLAGGALKLLSANAPKITAVAAYVFD